MFFCPYINASPIMRLWPSHAVRAKGIIRGLTSLWASGLIPLTFSSPLRRKLQEKTHLPWVTIKLLLLNQSPMPFQNKTGSLSRPVSPLAQSKAQVTTFSLLFTASAFQEEKPRSATLRWDITELNPPPLMYPYLSRLHALPGSENLLCCELAFLRPLRG